MSKKNYISDVFHWACLNERESALPSNTAPGGHTCPTCYDQIIPPSNLISPVADVLRNRLKKTSWGRDEFSSISVSIWRNCNFISKSSSLIRFFLIQQKTTSPLSDNSITKSNQLQISNSNSNNASESLSMKNNANVLSSSNANKSMVHESPKDHSINIDTTYYHGKKLLLFFNQSVHDQFPL